ncbi:hypothetical protein HPB51_001956 [Rhipicephalus microplus]|uniref:Uncharacterized protein n=1 Tax=Rhipicephalus microplus TaxID=6941 RepID=A0A9J6DYJ6_RHIMP|nr:hypothetical protein HPB51_001956 [Rhipicephalus microplus]
MPHEAMVEGEQISKDAAESNGWCTAHRKQNADKTHFKHETHSARQTGAHVGPAKASQLRKVAAASRLPRLPTSHFRVVVRPGGGLDVRTCSQLKVTYQVPYVVRRRRRKRRKGGHKTKNATNNAGDREIAAPTKTPSVAAPRNAATERSWSSRGGFNSQPTWVDKVAETGEAHAPAQPGQLSQQTRDKIQSLERENASLRQELSDNKSILQEMQQRERASSDQATGATASVNRGAKRRAGPEPMEEEALNVSSIQTLLEMLRSDVIAEFTPIRLQLTEHTARLQLLESYRQHALLGTPPSSL